MRVCLLRVRAIKVNKIYYDYNCITTTDGAGAEFADDETVEAGSIENCN